MRRSRPPVPVAGLARPVPPAGDRRPPVAGGRPGRGATRGRPRRRRPAGPPPGGAVHAGPRRTGPVPPWRRRAGHREPPGAAGGVRHAAARTGGAGRVRRRAPPGRRLPRRPGPRSVVGAGRYRPSGPTAAMRAPRRTRATVAPPTAGSSPTSRRLSSCGRTAFATPAGYGFYAADDDVRDFARAVRPADGLVTLDLHGSPQGLPDRRSADQPGPVRLRRCGSSSATRRSCCRPGTASSCSRATPPPAGQRSPAAHLARELGVAVVAPDLPVWTTLDGEEMVATPVLVDGYILPADPPDGAWHRFVPDGTTTLLGPTIDGPTVDGAAGRTAERGLTDHAPRGPDRSRPTLVAGDGVDARLVGAEHRHDRRSQGHRLRPGSGAPGRTGTRRRSSWPCSVSTRATPTSCSNRLRAGVRTNVPVAGVSDPVRPAVYCGHRGRRPARSRDRADRLDLRPRFGHAPSDHALCEVTGVLRTRGGAPGPRCTGGRYPGRHARRDP